jgi:2-phospho-L-lactate/phosphoenolpyruvate guanylyltransferase
MSPWLVVPVRSLRDGKSRLAPAFDAQQRRAFVEWLLVRTLERAAQFPGLERTLVVSACNEARAQASARGARVIEERAPGGLNNALRQAQLALRDAGVTRMLMVSSDLPLLQAEDLQCLAAASSAGAIAIAPDRTRQGTNGISLCAATDFDFSFGPNSFQRHLERLRQLDVDSTIVERTGLAFDVDVPNDLAELRALERRHGHCARLLPGLAWQVDSTAADW